MTQQVNLYQASYSCGSTWTLPSILTKVVLKVAFSFFSGSGWAALEQRRDPGA